MLSTAVSTALHHAAGAAQAPEMISIASKSNKLHKSFDRRKLVGERLAGGGLIDPQVVIEWLPLSLRRHLESGGRMEPRLPLLRALHWKFSF